MALPNPKKKRRYPFKRHLKCKLRKIAFMLIGAAIVSGINYYHKYEQTLKKADRIEMDSVESQ